MCEGMKNLNTETCSEKIKEDIMNFTKLMCRAKKEKIDKIRFLNILKMVLYM